MQGCARFSEIVQNCVAHQVFCRISTIVTDRKRKAMFSQVSVCPQSASRILVHCSALLQRDRYASYWNAFLFFLLSHKHFLFTLYFLCCLHSHFSGAPQKLIYLRHNSCNHLCSSTKQLSVLDIRFLRNVRGPVQH